MAKQVYSWGKVTAGDIISFRYIGKKQVSKKAAEGKQKVASWTTILVLNQRLPHTRRDGTKGFQVIGLKLEEQGTIPLIKNPVLLVDMLEKLGTIQVVDAKNDIFRVAIEGIGPLGATPRVYNLIKKKLDQFPVYRTYDYDQARKSAVFLEPIDLPKRLVESLTKNETVVEEIVEKIVEEVVERKTSVVTGADTTEEE